MNPKNEEIDIYSIQEKNLIDIQKSIEAFSSDSQSGGEGVRERISETQEKQGEEAITPMLEAEVNSDDCVGDTQVEEALVADIDKSFIRSFFSPVVFLCKYVLTAGFIFVVLMLGTNYSAYLTIAKTYLNPDAMAESEAKIEKTLEVSKISHISKKENPEQIQKQQQDTLQAEVIESHNNNDIRNIVGNLKKEEIDLDIEIIPFVNRLIIPKIGKNIPLIDIQQGSVENFDELNNIFMDELKGGVVRYPGSARPGEFGNAFIFGHSSNFPWIEGDYNDVFVLLDRLEVGDEVTTYYEGQKYVYKIREKKVISPDDTSILKRDTGKKEITLMTCWPIGTTYNRLLVIGELVTE